MKPDFWEDEKIGTISRDARLLFIATWNLADDTGILRWSAPYLKASVFMYDDDLGTLEVGDLMEELTKNDLVIRYTVEKTGQVLAQIPNFRKHQVINRPQPSKFPRPPWEAGPSVNDSVNDSLSLPTLFTVGKEEEIEIEEEGKRKGSTKGNTRASRSHTLPQGFVFTKELKEYGDSKSKEINWEFEFEKFSNYHTAKGSKFTNWPAAWRKWVTNAVEYAKPTTTPTGKAQGGQPWF